MGKVILDITMSLDGFIAGPNDDVEALHNWLFSGNTPSAYSDYFKLSKESAVKQAKKAAGKKNVYLVGGASVAQQCIKAELVDEMTIHLVPVLLGAGIRLFDHLGTKQIALEQTSVIEAPGVTHLTFRVVT